MRGKNRPTGRMPAQQVVLGMDAKQRGGEMAQTAAIPRSVSLGGSTCVCARPAGRHCGTLKMVVHSH